MSTSQQHLGNSRCTEKPKDVSAEQQQSDILSALPLSDWRGSVTTFAGCRRTRPLGQVDDAEWAGLGSLLAPGKPAIVSDKASCKLFLPCLLKKALLVGRTLEAAQKAGRPTVGKMRSQAHITPASMLVMDIDGLPEADFMAGLANLENDGITYLAYTTFSYGRADKPGIRARLIVPVDDALDADGYRAAWRGLDIHYWNGRAGKADPSGERLCQPQGVWCCHPERADKARSWANNGGVASAVALREIGALSEEPRVQRNGAAAQVESFFLPGGDARLSRLEEMIGAIDPDRPYDDWFLVLAIVFNETRGSEDGFALVNEWSSAGKKYKGEGELRQKWCSLNLDHPNPARLGSLIRMLRTADREAGQ